MPALSVADELKERESRTDILFVTTRKELDRKLIFDRGYRSKSILSGKFRRYFSLLNLVDPIFVVIGFFQSLLIILRFKPDVVFSKGGYVSLPLVYAAKVLGKKVVVHESDIEMGLANKLAAKVADRVCVSFPSDKYDDIKKEKIRYTGNPLKKIKEHPKRTVGKDLLFLGGSQGARKINETLDMILPDLSKDFNIVHLTGLADFKEIAKKRANLSSEVVNKYKIFPTVFNDDDFSRLLSEADVVISRAGASSISEAAYLGKALILVPLVGHQEKNAQFFVDKKAAISIKNENLTPDSLKEAIYKIDKDPSLKETLESNISEFSPKDARARIVSVIEELVH